jgi:hypothetical protein
VILQLTDKNIGSAIMNKENYIQQVLIEHVLMKDYRELTKIEGHYQTNLKKILTELLITKKNYLSSPK